jgi:hypothetical protein
MGFGLAEALASFFPRDTVKSGRSHCADNATGWHVAVTEMRSQSSSPNAHWNCDPGAQKRPDPPRPVTQAGCKRREEQRSQDAGRQRFESPRRPFQISRHDLGTNRRARPPTRKQSGRTPWPPMVGRALPRSPPLL